MDNWYKVKAKVVSQKGHCETGHKLGDEYVIDDSVPIGMCSWAFFALFPFVTALKSGGAFPWEKDKDTATVACPDPTNPVVFELKRIR